MIMTGTIRTITIIAIWDIARITTIISGTMTPIFMTTGTLLFTPTGVTGTDGGAEIHGDGTGIIS
jgi:hypothetical protein